MDRPEETSGLSAAPPPPPPAGNPAPGAPYSLWGFDYPPPRPLPASAFLLPATGAGAEAQPSSPAPSPPPEPHILATAAASAADDVFAAIEAEASSRSRSSGAQPVVSAPEISPAGPIDIRELVLPVPAAARPPDLGDTIPQRMFEPRFERPSQPALDGMEIERALLSDAASAPPPRPTRRFGSLARRVLKLAAWLVLAWVAAVLALIVAYRFVNPPGSMLMLKSWMMGEGVAQTWVPIDEISPNVVRAVLVSEDGRFCQHAGIDLDAIEEAMENTDGRTRGGSTISMQVVKNLFLWPSKSYVRKAIELPLTYFMELVWPKRRIMEVYLNIAEWGPGIFGVGAAAEYHFAKSARALSQREAARLAVSLPNPLVRNAGKPGPGLQRLANAIQVRMRLAPSSQFACVLSKRPY